MSIVLAALWNRPDRPGHEAIRWIERPSGWLLTGNAVFANEGEPCQLAYTVTCDSGWQTQSATVEGWAGRTPVAVQVEVDTGRRWWLNGLECADVAGCLDIDLSFSPSTNPFRCAGSTSAPARLHRSGRPGSGFRPLRSSHSSSCTGGWMRRPTTTSRPGARLRPSSG
jgi:hypothetical protein